MQEVYFRPLSNDGTVHGTALENWNIKVVEGAKLLGKDWWSVPHYAKVLLLPPPSLQLILHSTNSNMKANQHNTSGSKKQDSIP